MKKTLKRLAVIAAIGTVIGLIIAFLCNRNNDTDSLDFDLDDDDFDLDSDLQPVERGYVSLNKTTDSAKSVKEETTSEEGEKEETPSNIDEKSDPSI